MPAATADATTNDNGHLTVDAYLSRPGLFNYLASEIKPEWPDNAAVQAYADDAILVAYRPPEETTSDKYLESAKYVPVTDNHPPEMLNPENIRSYPVGTSTSNVKAEEGKPRAALVLWDARAIDAYHAGKKEISVGAFNSFVWNPKGRTPDGTPYDFEIRNSRVNHIAIVDRGRAGREVRILDSAPEAPKTERKTMEVTIGSASFDIDDNAAKLLEEERRKMKSEHDRLAGERDAALNRKLTDEQVKELVDAEIKKRAKAAKVEEMRAAIVDAGIPLSDDASADYIEGAYNGLGVKSGTADEVNSDATNISSDAVVRITAGPKTKTAPIDVQSRKRRLYR